MAGSNIHSTPGMRRTRGTKEEQECPVCPRARTPETGKPESQESRKRATPNKTKQAAQNKPPFQPCFGGARKRDKARIQTHCANGAEYLAPPIRALITSDRHSPKPGVPGTWPPRQSPQNLKATSSATALWGSKRKRKERKRKEKNWLGRTTMLACPCCCLLLRALRRRLTHGQRSGCRLTSHHSGHQNGQPSRYLCTKDGIRNADYGVLQ